MPSKLTVFITDNVLESLNTLCLFNSVGDNISTLLEISSVIVLFKSVNSVELSSNYLNKVRGLNSDVGSSCVNALTLLIDYLSWSFE